MTTQSLFEPVIDGGIQNPNWFEGRLLTAESMRAKDKAERQRQRLLGRAIGAGVFEGLSVSLGSAQAGRVTALQITRGAAINEEGELLSLSRDLSVDVVAPPSPAAAGGLFETCRDGSSPAPSAPSGSGVYVLLMCPASAYRERAPKSGLGHEGVVTGCGDAFRVDGVRFRTEKIEPQSISALAPETRQQLDALVLASAEPASRSLLRNLMAHYCLGTPELARFAIDPFALDGGASQWARYGALDDLRELGRITSCDVPLALFLWNDSGVAYVDLWAARRAPTPGWSLESAPLVARERLRLDARARLLQFQAQLAELIRDADTPETLRVRENFRYLPPAGLLTLANGGQHGVTLSEFFEGTTLRFPRPPRFGSEDGPEFIDGARLLTLLSLAETYPAIDLLAPTTNATVSPSRTEAIWLYRIRENARAIAASSAAPLTRSVVFAGGELPYFGSPRFDVSRWNYANYGSASVGPGGF